MSPLPKTELTTDRLILRPIVAEDMQSIGPILERIEVTRWLQSIPHPYPISERERFLEKVTRTWNDGSDYKFSVIAKEKGEIIGVASFKHHEDGEGEPGYFLSPISWGRGYATEVVERLLEWGQFQFSMTSFRARLMVGNEGSLNVLSKCGFEDTGAREKHFAKSLGRDVEIMWLELVRHG